MTSSHTWTFTSLGGFHQARMETAADFAHLGSLDQKLWAALACPVKGLAFDTATLALLDHDDDGRIRAPEVIEAAKWCTARLTSLDALAQGGQPLRLDHIRADDDEGKGLQATARQIAADLGLDGATLSVADVGKAAEALAKSARNGDGVVPADTLQDDEAKALATLIVETLGGADDRGGGKGVDQAQLDAFFAAAADVVAWSAKGGEDVHPLGDATAAAADAVATVRNKVDDFFARCRLAAFDARALEALNRKEEEYLAIAAEDLSVTADEVSGFPLARVEAGRPLPLTDGVNPAWAARLAALHAAAVVPFLGEGTDALTEAGWREIQGKLAAFEAWRGARPDSPVAGLDPARLQALLDGPGKEALAVAISADAATAPQVAAVDQVVRLVRYHRDLHELARNFVNFTDFYSDTARATFEAGTLFLDGRSTELVVRVDNPGKHAALAARSKLFLAYCSCTRPSGEKLAIAAAFTDGDADYLMVGRNGVFYDRDGKDWDATITKIVDNPISLRQAFWQPYKKIAGFFEERAAKKAAEKAAEADKKAMAGAKKVATDAEKLPKGEAKDAPKAPGIDVGVVAAIAVGLGALGSMAVALIGYITGLFAMPFWVICLVVLAIFLAISMPSVVLAWFKLRSRSLGPILDSNGWAVNGRAKVSVRFGRTLTEVAKLPKGSRIDAKDKYADPVNPWPRLLMFVVVVGFFASLLNWFGVIHELSGGAFGDPRSEEPLFEEPAAPPAAEAAAPAAP